MIMIEAMINSKYIISSCRAGLIETGNNSVNFVINPNSGKNGLKNISFKKKS